jgi:N-acetylmuramoyl-L-alanine amidase
LPENYSMRFVQIFLIIVFLSACAYNPYKSTNRVYRKQAKGLGKILAQQPVLPDSLPAAGYWAGTVNFNLRKPNFVIIHHTAQNSCAQTLKTFTLSRTQVSAHYVICKDGTVHQMLNDYLRAWHAGASRWGSLSDVNSCSIGIEIDNNGYEYFTPQQLTSLLVLLDTLKSRYTIPAANFIGHADIAPTRKNDPNIFFPWKLLSEKGFGRWYPDTSNLAVPAAFDNLQALRMIGYDVRDSAAAIIAFKRHYVQDTSAVLTDAEKKILYLLSKQL